MAQENISNLKSNFLKSEITDLFVSYFHIGNQESNDFTIRFINKETDQYIDIDFWCRENHFIYVVFMDLNTTFDYEFLMY
jgi:hypothetical protein